MPDQEVVPPCPVEDVVSCAVCGESTDDCSCTACNDCGELTNSICGNCEECFACCSCVVCTNRACGERVEELCPHCNECSDHCCNCGRCDAWGCSGFFDPDQDEYICSACSSCERDHCECSQCPSCGETVVSACPNCFRCTGLSGHCCTCVTCAHCDESVLSGDRCSNCERCESCECNCEVDQDEGEDSGVTLPPTTTHSHTGLTRCDRFCWGMVDGRWSVVHVYEDLYYGLTCKTCHTCRDHCRGNAACSQADEHAAGTMFHDVCSSCLACPTHCSCSTCLYSLTHKVKPDMVCEGCGNCLEHCSCPKCPKCSVLGSICNYCLHCKPCCTADDSECGAYGCQYPIPYTDNDGIVFHRPANRLGFRNNPFSREVGIEIETNGITYHKKSKLLRKAIEKWQVSVKSDGSIGSQPNAFELNLMPTSGDKLVEQVTELCVGLKAMGANPDHRCGIHVHVNCADVVPDDLKRILDVYSLVERALFGLCHPRRMTGEGSYTNYSVPCASAYKNYGKTGREVRQRIADEFFGAKKVKDFSKKKRIEDCPRCSRRGVRDLGNGKNKCLSVHCEYEFEEGKSKTNLLKSYGNHIKESKSAGTSSVTRYRALNLISLFKRQTIEFRHFHASTDPVEISNWAMVVCGVINASISMSNREISVLPTNSRKALLAILPKSLHSWVIDQWKRWDALVRLNPTYTMNRINIWGS